MRFGSFFQPQGSPDFPYAGFADETSRRAISGHEHEIPNMVDGSFDNSRLTAVSAFILNSEVTVDELRELPEDQPLYDRPVFAGELRSALLQTWNVARRDEQTYPADVTRQAVSGIIELFPLLSQHEQRINQGDNYGLLSLSGLLRQSGMDSEMQDHLKKTFLRAKAAVETDDN